MKAVEKFAMNASRIPGPEMQVPDLILQTPSGESVGRDFSDGVCKIGGTGPTHSKPLSNGYRLVDFERRSFGHLRSKLLREPVRVVGENGRFVAGT